MFGKNEHQWNMEEKIIMVARCKGVCDIIRAHQIVKRPQKLPYISHSHCRVCEIWFDKKEYINPRCPCCSTILAILPRENTKKPIYRKILHDKRT